MKSRELFTTPTLIVSNYTISIYGDGKFIHKFTPESSDTIYQFIGNKESLLTEGERYNIGYRKIKGVNQVDISVLAKADTVDPKISHYVARLFGEQQRSVETRKSLERVRYSGVSGLYLGKKYAWRIYGEAFTRGIFDEYLKVINYPTVQCLTDGNQSIAYKDEGLSEVMNVFVDSCVNITSNSNRFKSHLVPEKSWFNVKALSAITDRK